VNIKDLGEFKLFIVFMIVGLIVLSVGTFSEKYLEYKTNIKLLECVTQTQAPNTCKRALER
jgi:cell division protein FtsL